MLITFVTNFDFVTNCYYFCIVTQTYRIKMTKNNNIEKSGKKTVSLAAEEVQLLKDLAAKEKSFSKFSERLGIERTVLINTIWRGSAAPETIKKIRKFLQRQQQAA